MPRKSPYHPDDTTRTCTKCKVEMPLDEEHFPRQKHAGAHGWNRMCKPCMAVKRREYKATREEGQSNADWYADQAKRRAYGKKYRESRTPEQKAATKRQEYLRYQVPPKIKQLERLKFVASLDWRPFYRIVGAALQDAYGCGAQKSKEIGYMDCKATPEQLREFNDARTRYRESEISKRLRAAQKDFDLLQYDRSAIMRLQAELDKLTPEELEYARTYKPKKQYRDDLGFLSPQDRKEIEDYIQMMADRPPVEISPEQRRREDVLSAVMRLFEFTSYTEDETTLDRKWRERGIAKGSARAEEFLINHPDKELVREVMRELDPDSIYRGQFL